MAIRKIKGFLKGVLMLGGFVFVCPLPVLAVTGGVGTDLWKEGLAIIGKVIGILLGMAAVVALGFVVYGGIMYIASGGDQKALATARGTVTSAIIGFILILGAILIINSLCGAVGTSCFPEVFPALF